MQRIRWTPPALNDLKTISHRIEEQRNLATANRVCRHIYDSIQSLRRNPHTGRPGSEDGTRELVIQIALYCRLPAPLGSRSDSPHLARCSGLALMAV
ncbi:MAG TPA: type II toxin-antitoxin system RelE/ParE family toxin [Bryobacteraceae bacterium]|jgi:plasmid stabilization system protein ParE